MPVFGRRQTWVKPGSPRAHRAPTPGRPDRLKILTYRIPDCSLAHASQYIQHVSTRRDFLIVSHILFHSSTDAKADAEAGRTHDLDVGMTLDFLIVSHILVLDMMPWDNTRLPVYNLIYAERILAKCM